MYLKITGKTSLNSTDKWDTEKYPSVGCFVNKDETGATELIIVTQHIGNVLGRLINIIELSHSEGVAMAEGVKFITDLPTKTVTEEKAVSTGITEETLLKVLAISMGNVEKVKL